MVDEIEVLVRLWYEGVAVGSPRRNRDFQDGATRGCASGNKENQTRRVREMDEIDHEHGRFMQTRLKKTRFRIEVRIVEDGWRKVGKRKKRVKRGGNRERKRPT